MKTKKRSALVALVLAGTLGLSACGSTDMEGSSGSPESAPSTTTAGTSSGTTTGKAVAPVTDYVPPAGEVTGGNSGITVGTAAPVGTQPQNGGNQNGSNNQKSTEDVDQVDATRKRVATAAQEIFAIAVANSSDQQSAFTVKNFATAIQAGGKYPRFTVEISSGKVVLGNKFLTGSGGCTITVPAAPVREIAYAELSSLVKCTN